MPSGISEENIARYIAHYPEVNPEWLLTGKGPMFRETQQGEALSYAPQPEDPSIEALREAKERATEEAKEAWRKLAEARQKIVELTELVAALKISSAERSRQPNPEEQLRQQRAQEERTSSSQ